MNSAGAVIAGISRAQDPYAYAAPRNEMLVSNAHFSWFLNAAEAMTICR